MRDGTVADGSSEGRIRTYTLIATALLALAAVFLVAWTTARYGIGVSPDSAHYVGAARSLAGGRGLQFNGEPFTHWPPLYPLLLAALSRCGLEALHSARALAALLFVVNVVLIVCITQGQSRGIPYSGLIAGAVFLLTPEVIHAHLMAWSEPLFYALALLSVLLLVSWTRDRSRWLLLGIGTLVGLAMLTRFAGVTLLPPFLACILAARVRRPKRAWTDPVLFLAAAAIPMTIWLAWNSSVPHSGTDRAIQFHPPHTVHLAVLAILIIAMAYALWRQSVQRKDVDFDLYSRWALAFGVTYCGFLLFSVMFIDALTPLDGRILSPLLVFGIPFAFAFRPIHSAQTGLEDSMPTLSDRTEHSHPYSSKKSADRVPSAALSGRLTRSLPAPHILAASTLILMTVLRLGITASVIRQHALFGSGYTGADWRSSPTLRWVDRIPTSVPIYSNAPDALAFYGRTSLALPEAFSPTTLRANSRLSEQLSQLDLALRRGARIVYFQRSSRRYLVSADVIERCSASRPIVALPDGAIYGAAPK
jgi:hypothetical protein